MSLLDFRPYVFPTPAFAGWDREFNALQAQAYIAPRGIVTAFLLPRKAKRYVLISDESGGKVLNRLGRRISTYPAKVREVLKRLPIGTIVDASISEQDVTILDVLFSSGQDVRGQRLEERLGFWWYMPDSYRNRSFYTEENSYKLGLNIFKKGFTKVIFKPDTIPYPKKTIRKKVYNWLEMSKPKGEES